MTPTDKKLDVRGQCDQQQVAGVTVYPHLSDAEIDEVIDDWLTESANLVARDEEPKSWIEVELHDLSRRLEELACWAELVGTRQ